MGVGVCGSKRGAAKVLAVVVTVMVAFTAVVPLNENEAGDGVHVAPAGAPVHVKVVVAEKPPAGVKVNV